MPDVFRPIGIREGGSDGVAFGGHKLKATSCKLLAAS
jgi:hypothetical protein